MSQGSGGGVEATAVAVRAGEAPVAASAALRLSVGGDGAPGPLSPSLPPPVGTPTDVTVSRISSLSPRGSRVSPHDSQSEEVAVAVRDLLAAPLSSIARLDDAVVTSILSYLSPKDLGRVSCADARLRGLAGAPAVWTHLFTLDFQPRPVDLRLLANSPAAPKNMYKSRVIARQGRIDVFLRDKQEKMRVQRMRRSQNLLHLLVSTYNIIFVIGLPMLLLLLATIFLADKLQGRVAWSFWAVFSPVWALCGILTLNLCVGICAWRYKDQPGHTSVWQHLWDRDDHTWSYLHFMLESVGDSRRARVHGGFMLCMALAAPIMICAKLEGSAMPWAVTFLPLWFLIIAYFTMACSRFNLLDGSDAKKVFLCTWPVVIAGAVSLMLLTARLHGHHISLTNVFVPVWIIAAAVWLACAIGWTATCIPAWRQGNRRDCCGIFLMYLLMQMFTVPPLLFFALLASNDSGATHVSPVNAFVPIFLWLAFLSLLGIILAVVATRYFRASYRVWVRDAA